MYESPIELVYHGKPQWKIDEEILQYIQEMGINVDREELIKALAYDRGQYDKGYKDGKAARRKGHWIVDEDGNIKCSECGQTCVGDNYCEHCGADMREEKEDV